MATNPAFVMCPAGEAAFAVSPSTVACGVSGTASGNLIYLGDAAAFGSTGDPSSSFSDGLSLGWGVVAAMVAAYAINLGRKALLR